MPKEAFFVFFLEGGWMLKHEDVGKQRPKLRFFFVVFAVFAMQEEIVMLMPG